MKIIQKTTLEQIIQLAESSNRLVYGVMTCWWKIGDPVYKNSIGLPCGPRGEVLFEMPDPKKFVEAAQGAVKHYGKHGMDAFVAAYHGNLIDKDGKPTSLEGWGKYNEILDKQKVQSGG